jgi:hypothetical protein
MGATSLGNFQFELSSSAGLIRFVSASPEYGSGIFDNAVSDGGRTITFGGTVDASNLRNTQLLATVVIEAVAEGVGALTGVILGLGDRQAISQDIGAGIGQSFVAGTVPLAANVERRRRFDGASYDVTTPLLHEEYNYLGTARQIAFLASRARWRGRRATITGDLTGDGRVTPADVQFVQQFVASRLVNFNDAQGAAIQSQVATLPGGQSDLDVDQDGTVTGIKDAAFLNRVAFGSQYLFSAVFSSPVAPENCFSSISVTLVEPNTGIVRVNKVRVFADLAVSTSTQQAALPSSADWMASGSLITTFKGTGLLGSVIELRNVANTSTFTGTFALGTVLENVNVGLSFVAVVADDANQLTATLLVGSDQSGVYAYPAELQLSLPSADGASIAVRSSALGYNPLFHLPVENSTLTCAALHRPCNTTSDYYEGPLAFCGDLTQCIAGVAFETTAPTVTTDRECTQASTCSGGQFARVLARGRNDTICANISSCGPLQFVAINATQTSDVICQNHTICSSDRAILVDAGEYNDRICERDVAASSAGTEAGAVAGIVVALLALMILLLVLVQRRRRSTDDRHLALGAAESGLKQHPAYASEWGILPEKTGLNGGGGLQGDSFWDGIINMSTFSDSPRKSNPQVVGGTFDEDGYLVSKAIPDMEETHFRKPAAELEPPVTVPDALASFPYRPAPIDETESIHSLDRISSEEQATASADAPQATSGSAAPTVASSTVPLASTVPSVMPPSVPLASPISVDENSRRSSMSSTVSLTELNADEDQALAEDFASLQANPPQMPQPDYEAQRRRRNQREHAWEMQQKTFAEQETLL